MNTPLFDESSFEQHADVSTRFRAPFAWYGGKYYYATDIVAMFPKHRVYVEPFLGAGNVLLAKSPSEVEIVNDLDSRIINFFKVLRDRETFAELVRVLSLTPYSRAAFGEVCREPEPKEPVQRAWWFFVRCRQARGGVGMSDNLTANRWATSSRSRRSMAEPVSKYLSAIEGLEPIAERFRTIAIECRPALDVIDQYDAKDVLFYCDPPYLPATRSKGEAATYFHEMTIDDHQKLLDRLVRAQGRVIVSGYDSELYNSAFAGWQRAEFEGKAHMNNSGGARREVIWMNYH